MLKPPIVTPLSAIERLLQERVAPWVERLPWQASTPLRYDESEGYKGRGVLGCRAGPLDSIGFEHLAHELAHAFEILESKGPQALGQPQWGMRIRTRVRVGSQVFFEPVTFAPTERECRTTGIQRRLMELVGHPLADTLFDDQAKVLLHFMPDWHQGGTNEAQRLSRRKAVMEEAYQAWPAERVLATWPAVFQALEQAAAPRPETGTARKLGR